MMTGRGARFGLDTTGDIAAAGLAASDALALLATSCAEVVATSIAEATAKSAELKARPAGSGIRIVEKKFRPTLSLAVSTFCFGGAPSRCMSSLDQFPLRR